MYLKQTMFLGYIVLQFILHIILFLMLNVLYIIIIIIIINRKFVKNKVEDSQL